MSNLYNRIKQLEKDAGPCDVYKYMCVMYDENSGVDIRTPEERAKGIKIQPFTSSFGGNGGAPFYLATYDELKAFAGRADVDLTIIVVGREEKKPDQVNE